MKQFIKLLLAASMTFSSTAYGAVSPVEMQEVQPINLVRNAGFENGLARWIASPVGTTVKTTVNPLIESTHATFTPTLTGQYLQSALVAVPEGLKGGACMAALLYKTTASNYLLKVLDESNNTLATQTLGATVAVAQTGYVGFNCPSSGSIRLRVESQSAAAAISIDRTHLGTVLDQSELIFEVGEWIDGGPITIGAITTAPTKGVTSHDKVYYRQEGNSVHARYEYRQTATTGAVAGSGDYLFALPAGFQFDTTKLGLYTTATVGQAFTQTNIGIGSVVISTGTSNGVGVVVPYSATQFRILVVETNVTATSRGIAGSGFYPVTNANAAYSMDFTFPAAGLSRTTADSKRAVRVGTEAWKVDANIGGTQNIDLGNAAQTAYVEMTNANLDLVNNTGLGNISAQIACSGTNPSTGLTCAAGNESNGIAFNLPEGYTDVQACASFTHRSNLNANGLTHQNFQIVETPNNAQTILQEGKTRIGTLSNSGTSGVFHMPARVCGNFSFATSGLKTLRVMYEKLTDVNNLANQIVADRSGATGQPDIHWEVYPLNVGRPNPIILNSVSTPNDNGERIIRARIAACSVSPCTIQAQSGGVASVTRVGSGTYNINFVAGTFSDIPACTVTGRRANAAVTSTTYLGVSAILGITESAGDNGVLNDHQDPWNFICMGPR